ncbi:putative uncharacterized protein [Clostridium sp. CAG:510]|mgnify:FL=1|nr:putative uncharacterized protein [Clostridium sp. CAG:510]
MQERTQKQEALLSLLEQKGYPQDLCQEILRYMSTDFMIDRMTAYLRQNAHPSPEEAVDEMLAILEDPKAKARKKEASKIKVNDKAAMQQDKAAANKAVTQQDMFIRSFSIDWDKLEDGSYVKEIPALNSLREFQFRKRITFFVGENGSGKSTLLEALAIAKGLNPEGGTRNYNFSTYDDYSTLKSAITFQSGMLKPKWSYFLRAESFYNVASEAARNYNDDGCMTDFHARSHGESFLEFILENDEKGLYFMDEPEAALSPQRQLTLLLHLVKMAEKGSQFIIVTHSPILLGTPDADIVSFDEGELHRISYEETESYQVTKLFLENREVMLRQLLQEETECETDAKI